MVYTISKAKLGYGLASSLLEVKRVFLGEGSGYLWSLFFAVRLLGGML